jgi:hypothetical protein
VFSVGIDIVSISRIYSAMHYGQKLQDQKSRLKWECHVQRSGKVSDMGRMRGLSMKEIRGTGDTNRSKKTCGVKDITSSMISVRP